MPSDRFTLSDDEAAGLADKVKDWVLVRETDSTRYWEAEIEPGVTIGRTEYLESDTLFRVNEELRNDRAGQRFTEGLGSDKGGNLPMVHTAQIPLNVFYREIAPRQRAGDREHLRWWLRQEQNAAYRTRDGNLRK